jgi:hypothetical protein
VNLFSSGRVESAELANRLGRERLPIHKKEDAVDELGFEQPIHLNRRFRRAEAFTIICRISAVTDVG